jgi:hypothetical protein
MDFMGDSARMATMSRTSLVLCLAAGLLLWNTGLASAGGTVVIAPDSPTRADCKQGSSPDSSGFADESLIVLGCATPPRSAPVVLAADNSDAFACFYVAPPGATNGGPCAQVRSADRQFGGPLTARKRSSSPLTGGHVISGLQIGTYKTGSYVSGQVPASADQVTISPGAVGAGPFFEPAALVEVPRSLGASIGATHPFSIFVARVSPRLQTCAGIHVVARTNDGPLSADITKSDRAFPSKIVPLPQTRLCSVAGAPDIALIVEEVAKAFGIRARGA